jgi:hypothetical protein
MNKRIKELLEQVGVIYNVMPKDTVYEKFAELIVMECLNKISGLIIPETFEQDIEPYEKWNQALGHAALEIEQHFFGDLK